MVRVFAHGYFYAPRARRWITARPLHFRIAGDWKGVAYQLGRLASTVAAASLDE